MKYKIVFLFSTLFCMTFSSLILADDASDLEMSDNFIQYHYVPPSFKIHLKKSEDGNYIDVIQNETKTYVSFYYGDEMSFPVRPIEREDEAARLKFNNIEILSEWKGEELVGRQILFMTGREWPSRIIAWTAPGLSQAELKTADKILFSLEVNFTAEQ